jgi:methylglutaconyl-CoA hydratase
MTVEIERRGKSATIWMNRPAVFNAFDETLIEHLDKACATLNADDTVRVVVLAGRGKHFSAGADLQWMQRASQFSREQNLADAKRFAAMLHRLATMGKPTIARVQGAALGGGTGLTAACDMAIASQDAVFATSEVKFGIIPAVISPYVLRAMGPRQALRYFQSGEKIRAEEALRLGLVNEVCPLSDLDSRIAQWEETLLQGGPLAQQAAKALIGSISGRPIDGAVIGESAERIASQRAGAEAREGIAAFLEKRPPAWLV